jgi:hypothetical protein
MRNSRLHFFGWGLVATTFLALGSASLGTEQASSSTGCNGSPGFYFELGVANICQATTTLSAPGGSPGGKILTLNGGGFVLSAYDGSGGGTALRGYADNPTATGPGGIGVHGITAGVIAGDYGVVGDLTPVINGGVSRTGNPSAGVLGRSSTDTGPNGPGVFGWHFKSSGTAPGVLGETDSTSASATGVKGIVSPGTTGSLSAGVEGANNGTNFGGFGVFGHHAGQGIGVYGEAPVGFALSGYSTFNWAAYLQGSVNVVGTLFKSSGAFRIDNPLDPAHSYLQHSFVESPDMKNIYDGNVTTNGKGFATVKLPAYFQAVNRDFRYQLTIVGSSFAQAIVSKEIQNNRFTIRTNKPNIKVSWQVTGIRKDAWANAHRIQTVVPKTGSADNKYVHPELYGKPLSKSVVVLPGMRPGTQPKFNAPTLPKQK